MISDSLIREVEASRRAIHRDVTALHYQMDFQARAKDAIRNRPALWLGGSAAIGFVFAIFGRRPRKKSRPQAGASPASAAVVESAKSLTVLGVVLSIIKTLLPLARPVLTAFAARRFAEMASKL